MAAAYKIIPGITRTANLGAQIRTYAFTLKEIIPRKEIPLTHYNDIKDKIKSMELDNVSFTHGDREILKNFNASFVPGDFIGIAAASGKGKTTLINLILGFLEAGSGHIMYNGLPSTAPVRQQYWHDIAYVKQQNFLIHDTIARNITLSESIEAPERLNLAMKITGLESFVQSFTDGYDKIITDSGKNISGGQRQRIALARALYKDAGVFILDEPFNELDDASEKELLQYFKSLAVSQGKIIILITHNPASLEHCNKIISVNA